MDTKKDFKIDTGKSGIDVPQSVNSSVPASIDSPEDRILRQHGELKLVDWKPITNAFLDHVKINVRIGAFMAGNGGKDLVLPCSKYPCCTQPPALPAPMLGVNELYIGFNDTIPLWNQGTTVYLAVYDEGWPTSEHGQYAAAQLYKAAQAWNDIGARVKFDFTTDVNKATYLMVYGGDNGGVYAMAEFPSNKYLSSIFVYSLSFAADSINYMTNILTHELGHTLGLRHEFADKEGQGDILWGVKNPNSVMSYKFPPTIQSSDEEYFKSLYDYSGDDIERVHIMRYGRKPSTASHGST